MDSLLKFLKDKIVDKMPLELTSARQIPNPDDQYCQLHVDILYKPTGENEIFSETTWDEDLNENIFNYIRKSEAFAYAKNQEYIKVKI